MTTIKSQTINNLYADAILGNRASYAHALYSVERVLGKVLGHFPWDLGPCMNAVIADKKLILLLKFACSTDHGPKKFVAWSINDNFVLQN